MGMRSAIAARKAATGGYDTASSTGTASFPVTAFPRTAYLGNNRRVGTGNARPSAVGSGLGSISNYQPSHLVIALGIIAGVGLIAWHLDNK